jgi:hypothetical protein
MMLLILESLSVSLLRIIDLSLNVYAGDLCLFWRIENIIINRTAV